MPTAATNPESPADSNPSTVTNHGLTYVFSLDELNKSSNVRHVRNIASTNVNAAAKAALRTKEKIMKRYGLILLLGAALVAQTGCDDLDDLGLDIGFYGGPGYDRYGPEVYYEDTYVEEYWVEETYYEETWYDDWYILPW